MCRECANFQRLTLGNMPLGSISFNDIIFRKCLYKEDFNEWSPASLVRRLIECGADVGRPEMGSFVLLRKRLHSSNWAATAAPRRGWLTVAPPRRRHGRLKAPAGVCFAPRCGLRVWGIFRPLMPFYSVYSLSRGISVLLFRLQLLYLAEFILYIGWRFVFSELRLEQFFSLYSSNSYSLKK